MKLSVAFFLLTLYTVNALPTGDDTSTGSTHTRHETGHSSIHKAANDLTPAERRFGSGDSPSSIQCAATCSQEEDRKRDQQTSNDGESEQEKLNKKCRIHDETKTCYNRCPNSQMKAKMTNRMIVDQYKCHDSTYRQNVQCITEAQESTANARQSKCGQIERKSEQYNQNLPTSLNGLKDMILQNCLLMKCHIDSDKAKIIEKCGQSAFNDYRGVKGKTAESIKNAMEILRLDVYPRECDRIATA